VFARLLQGLSVGGEYGTSATYLSEMATKERRGFFSSFQYVTLISGQLIALAVLIVLQQTLTTEQLYAWGWRIRSPSARCARWWRCTCVAAWKKPPRSPRKKSPRKA
jgi:MFS family permease